MRSNFFILFFRVHQVSILACPVKLEGVEDAEANLQNWGILHIKACTHTVGCTQASLAALNLQSAGSQGGAAPQWHPPQPQAYPPAYAQARLLSFGGGNQ